MEAHRFGDISRRLCEPGESGEREVGARVQAQCLVEAGPSFRAVAEPSPQLAALRQHECALGRGQRESFFDVCDLKRCGELAGPGQETAQAPERPGVARVAPQQLLVSLTGGGRGVQALPEQVAESKQQLATLGGVFLENREPALVDSSQLAPRTGQEEFLFQGLECRRVAGIDREALQLHLEPSLDHRFGRLGCHLHPFGQKRRPL